jgi:hypothetical protein
MIRTALGLAAAASLLTAGCLADEEDLSRSRASLDTPDCGHFAGAIVNKDGAAFGYVVVSNSEDTLFVEVEAWNGYLINAMYLYAGTEPTPANSYGITWPEWFPYQVNITESWPTTYTFAIPLDELGVEAGVCGQLELSLYVRFKELDANGNVLKNHRGWAYGDKTLQHGSHGDVGYAFNYAICCEPPPEEYGCTLTQGYWKTHNIYAAQSKKQVDWPAMHPDDQLCGMTLLDILDTPPQGDAWFILAHQYIAASLNVASGASTTDQVDQALADAEAFLTANCAGIPAADAPDALNDAGILDAYNNGDIGPGHCD